MELVADILLVAGALGAGFYCYFLAQRLNRFNDLEKGVGGAVAVLSTQVDHLSKALEAAQSTSEGSSAALEALTERAESVAQRLELMMASMHDMPLPETADPQPAVPPSPPQSAAPAVAPRHAAQAAAPFAAQTASHTAAQPFAEASVPAPAAPAPSMAATPGELRPTTPDPDPYPVAEPDPPQPFRAEEPMVEASGPMFIRHDRSARRAAQ
ncbi:hypothetical protein [Chachezhania sediminis]|uniref:hypothetical protein n=1 Tax=Chachezhania sediminis TaxID=2599291 RepID=UPI0038990E72